MEGLWAKGAGAPVGNRLDLGGARLTQNLEMPGRLGLADVELRGDLSDRQGLPDPPLDDLQAVVLGQRAEGGGVQWASSSRTLLCGVVMLVHEYSHWGILTG